MARAAKLSTWIFLNKIWALYIFECAIDAKGKNNYYSEKYNIIEHIVIQSNMISF